MSAIQFHIGIAFVPSAGRMPILDGGMRSLKWLTKKEKIPINLLATKSLVQIISNSPVCDVQSYEQDVARID